MINSKSTDELHPLLARKAKHLVKLAEDKGIRIIITSTYRDFEYQDYLYSKGRTRDLKDGKVTNAKAGSSYHNFRLAFDICPIRKDAVEPFKSKDFLWEDKFAFFEVGKLGESIGLEWGGRFKTFVDMPHFQLRGIGDNKLGLQDLRDGKTLDDVLPEDVLNDLYGIVEPNPEQMCMPVEDDEDEPI